MFRNPNRAPFNRKSLEGRAVNCAIHIFDVLLAQDVLQKWGTLFRPMKVAMLEACNAAKPDARG